MQARYNRGRSGPVPDFSAKSPVPGIVKRGGHPDDRHARPRHRNLLRRNRPRGLRHAPRPARPRAALAGDDARSLRRRGARARVARSRPPRRSAGPARARGGRPRRSPISTASPIRRAPGSPARCSSARASPTGSASRSASRSSAFIISRVTCSRRCSPIPRPRSPSSPCWFRAGTANCSRSPAWGGTACSATRWTMRPARRSTRPPSCSACPILAGRRSRVLPSRGATAPWRCRGRCWTAATST